MSNDDERRKKFWDDDDDETTWGSPRELPGPGSSKGPDSAQIDRLIQDTRVLMEQTHQLYQQYFNGIERRPPIEKARLLESKMQELHRIVVTLTTAKFKVSQFISQYNMMKELWERKLKEKERK